LNPWINCYSWSGATTHFITVKEEDADICAEMKSMSAATRKLYNMVTDFFGASVYPVELYLLYLTDDTITNPDMDCIKLNC
jgi:hypothetical protein